MLQLQHNIDMRGVIKLETIQRKLRRKGRCKCDLRVTSMMRIDIKQVNNLSNNTNLEEIKIKVHLQYDTKTFSTSAYY